MHICIYMYKYLCVCVCVCVHSIIEKHLNYFKL